MLGRDVSVRPGPMAAPDDGGDLGCWEGDKCIDDDEEAEDIGRRGVPCIIEY